MATETLTANAKTSTEATNAKTSTETAHAGYLVRLARPEEYAEVDRLIAAAYAHDYGDSDEGPDPMRSARRRAEAHDVWVAVDAGGRLLGSATTRRRGGPSLHEDAVDGELDLRLLGVSPLARRRGVAAALMRHVVAHAEAEGFGAVVLKTRPHMSGAHRLYDALGFTRVPERDGLWIGGERVLELFAYAYPLAGVPEVGVDDPAAARSVLGRFPSGVVAITAADASGEPVGLAVQSFVSLSIDPPRVLLSVGRGSTTWPRISAGGSFAATVLAEHQGPIARQLARSGAADKFAGIRTTPSPRLGHPIVRGGSAWFECAIREVLDGGDHRVVIADVLGFGALHRPERPLVFAGSSFSGIAPASAA
ncbi:GNAT family N-acetyltransferase [Leucobacter sp. CSA1]|uniref:GNAT family N-acetyltransferase n=1 Tax=Leucobacter chromiisoli TaxID=2796471 RepID=A0A934Q971_9MICO|nr:GNAT family N-acetyltransferase [Leucobacter chromiisoli]MBK0419446.1 GNAT family N-acetyltransferase [Leucobacter chromiisoli]